MVTKEVAELLIAAGAGVNVVHGRGETPLDWAEKVRRTDTSEKKAAKKEIADLLRKHGGKTGEWLKAGESIHKAARVGHIEAVKQHLANGEDVNAKKPDGETPLHIAAYEGYKEVAELLIANGADVNAKGDWGRTPLYRAAMEGHKEIVELLIAKGADVNAMDDFGRTPLYWAKRRKHKETADLLRKHGGKTGEELKAEGK